jgi:hypothetical protein
MQRGMFCNDDAKIIIQRSTYTKTLHYLHRQEFTENGPEKSFLSVF